MIKSLLRKRQEGFTLVELMIVVAIIGILAALAIYGVSRYVKHSKTAEATRAISAIETGSKTKYQKETEFGAAGSGTFVHNFCTSAAATPAITALRGQKQKVTSGAGTGYNLPGWVCLNFSIGEPQNYSYTYTSNAPAGTGTGATYTAIASGDLDGNGTQSDFRLIGRGAPTGDAERVSLVILNEDE